MEKAEATSFSMIRRSLSSPVPSQPDQMILDHLREEHIPHGKVMMIGCCGDGHRAVINDGHRAMIMTINCHGNNPHVVAYEGMHPPTLHL